MKNYEVKTNQFNTYKFDSIKGIKNIKQNAINKLKTVPECFNVIGSGKWAIVELVENGSIAPGKKFITYITI